MRKQILTAFAVFFLISFALAETITVSGNITSNTTWTADNIYVLAVRVYVTDGATLTIEPGTVIKAQNGTGDNIKSLIITRGSKIMAEGTVNNPIIFTSVNDDVDDPDDLPWDAVGEWGGIAILGAASINATGGEDVFEAIPAGDDQSLGLYGGGESPNDEDTSGVLRYVSIRHGGAEVKTDKEMNGLSLAGVGSGTEISYVEAWSSSDDGFEWWGGNHNVDHLAAGYCQDESFDHDEGLNVKMQFIFAIRNAVGQHIGEHDGAPKDAPGNLPEAYPVIYNATFLGGGSDAVIAEKSMFRLRENWGGEYNNSIFGSYNGTAMQIDSVTTPDSWNRLDGGEIIFNNNLWFDFSAGTTWDDLVEDKAGAAEVIAYFDDVANKNVFTDPLLANIFRGPAGNVEEGLDPRPEPGPAWENLKTYPAGFENVEYKGAFGETNWLTSWTAFHHYGFLGNHYVSVEDEEVGTGVVRSFVLHQNYPNPFNPSTTIKFDIKQTTNVKMYVYNSIGQRVATLINGKLNAGKQQVIWNAQNMASGTYFYQLRTGNQIVTKRMLLLK